MTTTTRKYPDHPKGTYSGQPMHKEVRDRWLADLRDPKRKQGKGFLRRSHKDGLFECCLGVLLDGQGCQWTESSVRKYDGDAIWAYADDRESMPRDSTFRSYFVVGWPETLCVRGAGWDIKLASFLAALNDGLSTEMQPSPFTPWTFLEIANWIEENIPEYDDTDGKGGETCSQTNG